MRLVGAVFHNFWPKLFSLFLAIATWFYVFDLINHEAFTQKKETETWDEVIKKYDFIVKEVPVRPVFTGRSPAGYQVDMGNVIIKPDRVSIWGPAKLLDPITELVTETVNLGEYTRPTSLRRKILTNVRSFKLEQNEVDIFLPVQPEEKSDVQ